MTKDTWVIIGALGALGGLVVISGGIQINLNMQLAAQIGLLEADMDAGFNKLEETIGKERPLLASQRPLP